MASEKKAPEDGVITDGRGRFKIKQGDPIPDGMTFAKADAPVVSERARKPAAENRAKPAATENRDA